MTMKNLLRSADGVTRRDFCRYAAQAFLGVTLMPTGFAAAAASAASPTGRAAGGKAKSVIYLYMNGGMSHLDTFDTKPGSNTQGPTESIKSSADSLLIGSTLPSIARHMDKIAVIRSMNSTQGAHEQGVYFMHTSYVLRGTIQHPGMGAWILKLDGRHNDTLPGNVVIGGGSNVAGAGFMEASFAPLAIDGAGLPNSHRASGVTEEQFTKRLEMADHLDRAFQTRFDQKKVRAYKDMYADAIRLMNSNDLQVFDIDREPENVREAYGSDRFGQGCLLARRLVEKGVRFVEVSLGGWDTHQDNFDRVADQSETLDRGMSALLEDLSTKGMLEDTLVVLATEFGRTPNINANDGRDHYPKAFSCLLAGGGVKGGQAWGKTDKTGGEVEENPVSIPDFNATIAYALGLPTDKIIYSPSQRPFTVADKGKPITAIF